MNERMERPVANTRRKVWAIIILAAALTVIAAMSFNLSALPQPGRFETRVADISKGLLVDRASRHGIPPRPVNIKASIAAGGEHYGLDCSFCHSDDGHGLTPVGEWMYPRASDLASKRVQSYSDQELYWIIKNGIRFTGMPAYGKVETPDHIWDLVNYVRTLPSNSQN
jgi:mono/diheme cytochrome c family protein